MDQQHGQGTFTSGEGQWKGDKYLGSFRNNIFSGKEIYLSFNLY